MLDQENVNTRLNRLERQAKQLRFCVFLLLGYFLVSSGVGYTIANVPSGISDTITGLMDPAPSSVSTEPQESTEPREQAKSAVSSPSVSKPALTKLANVSDLVQTRRLQLIGNDGTAVLDFFVSPTTGGGAMDVHNGDGARVMQLYGNPNGGLLRIYQPDGTSELMFFGVSTKQGAIVSLGGNGKTGMLSIKNTTDQVAVALATGTESMSGGLWLNNADGNNLLTAGPTELGHGSLWIRDKSGERIVAQLASNNSGGIVELWDTNSTTLLRAGPSYKGHGYIQTWTSTGHSLFYAGNSGDDTPVSLLKLNRLGSGEQVAYLGESMANTGLLALGNSDGRQMVQAFVQSNKGIIKTLNSDGNMLFRLDGLNGNGRVRTFTSSGQTAFSSDNVTVSGSSTSGLTGDIDGDGDVDGDDFLLLSHHFGNSSTKKTVKTEEDGQ